MGCCGGCEVVGCWSCPWVHDRDEKPFTPHRSKAIEVAPKYLRTNDCAPIVGVRNDM